METQQLQVSTEQIMAAMTQLSLPELERVHERVLRLQAERKVPHLSAEETQLLKRINQGVSLASRERRAALQAKRESGTIIDGEYEELTNLVLKAEELHAERMEAVSKLARLRGVGLLKMMEQLGLSFPENA